MKTLIYAFSGTVKEMRDAELHPELHPMKPWQQWELDGAEQAIKYAKQHHRDRLYQAYTGDLAD
jgi:argininosuccinate synthase